MNIVAVRRLRTIAIVALAVSAIATVTGATYESVARSRADKTFPMPGRLVDVGHGRRIHLDCRGAGSPTVVFESGLDYMGSLSWAAVHDSIARTTRACAYSRAGIMWSDPSVGKFDSRASARDLHSALLASGEIAPWIMVGHSLGGPYVMTFTDAFPNEVRGLVLVEPSHPEQFERFHAITGKSLQPATGMLKFGTLVARIGIVRMMTPDAPPSWPRAGAAFLPLSIRAFYKETAAFAATLATVRPLRDLGDRPLVVLTGEENAPTAAAITGMGLSPEQGKRLLEAARSMHDEVSTWSRHGRHEVVPNTSHYIQFDRPDVVIRAVREVAAAVRARAG